MYEAIGAVADGRVEVVDNTAKVYSSSRNKYYDVSYDPLKKAIMSNDNGSYWKGYLGYPAVAYLMKKGVVSYEPKLGEILKGVPWKDINQKFKNDFEKALEFILSTKTDNERRALAEHVAQVGREIEALELHMLGDKTKPPEGY
jgi:hypothetical protein